MMLGIERIDVYYGRIKALKQVSLKVNEGELITLLGANGAGKTTLLLTLSGVAKPVVGSVEFLGKRIDKMPAHKPLKGNCGSELLLEMSLWRFFNEIIFHVFLEGFPIVAAVYALSLLVIRQVGEFVQRNVESHVSRFDRLGCLPFSSYCADTVSIKEIDQPEPGFFRGTKNFAVEQFIHGIFIVVIGYQPC